MLLSQSHLKPNCSHPFPLGHRPGNHDFSAQHRHHHHHHGTSTISMSAAISSSSTSTADCGVAVVLIIRYLRPPCSPKPPPPPTQSPRQFASMLSNLRSMTLPTFIHVLRASAFLATAVFVSGSRADKTLSNKYCVYLGRRKPSARARPL